MKNKKILIIGPISPPFGGVSIHIERLSNILKDYFKLDFIDESRVKKDNYFNIRSGDFYQYLKKVRNSDLVYIHSGKKILRVFHLFIAKLFSKKIIITIHSYPAKTPTTISYVNGIVYRIANKIVIVNSELKIRLLLPQHKYILKEAFLPPVIEEEPELPEYIVEWLSINRKKGYLIVCANASYLDTYNNEDLYGLDLCIEVTKRFLEEGIPVKFIFVVASIDKNYNEYLRKKALIKDLKLQSDFLLINEKLSFVKVIELSDIVLRPTNTDGDAITIREGLFLNKIVLASDVVKRPDNVFLFKNRNINDLESKLINMLQIINKKEYHSSESSKLRDDLRIFYLQLIKNTFEGKEL